VGKPRRIKTQTSTTPERTNNASQDFPERTGLARLEHDPNNYLRTATLKHEGGRANLQSEKGKPRAPVEHWPVRGKRKEINPLPLTVIKVRATRLTLENQSSKGNGRVVNSSPGVPKNP